MDAALRNLRLCHAIGNTAPLTKCRSQQRCRGRVCAAAPLTHSQRTLLHSAINGGRSLQRQQEDGMLEWLVAHGPAPPPPSEQHQQQPVRDHATTDQTNLQHAVQHSLQAAEQQQQQPLLQRPAWDSSVPDPHGHSQQSEHIRPQQQPQQHSSSNNSSSNSPDSSASIQTQQQYLQQQLQLRQLLRQQEQRRRQLELLLRTQPAVLTSLIKAAKTWQQLQHLFDTYTAFFNSVHVSATLTHLAQIMGPLQPKLLPHQPQGLQQLLADLASATAACVPDYGPRQLANTLWAMNRLGFGEKVPRKVQAAYLTAFDQKLPVAAPQHISNVALAVSGMGWRTSTQWRQRLLLAAASKQQFFKPQELANLLYALPLLEVKPPQQWLSSFLNTCYGNLLSFNSQELSLLGMGLVKLNHRPSKEWLAGYMQAVHVQLNATGSTTMTATTNAATTTTSSSSTSSESAATPQHTSRWHSSDANAAAGVVRQIGFQAQGLVNVLRVLSCWGASPTPDWQASCLAAAEQLSSQLSMRGISTLLWAVARMQLVPSAALLARLLQVSQQKLQHATSTDLALLAWALGTLGVTLQHSSNPPDRAPSTAVSRSSGDIDNSLLTSWASDFLYHSYRRIGAGSAQDVSCLLVGVVRMRLRPGSLWLEAVAVEVHHRLSSMTARELTNSLLCLARLKLKPSAAFMASFCSCSNMLLIATTARSRRRNGTAAAAARRRLSSGGNSSSRSSSTRSMGSTVGAWYCPQTLANTLGAMAMMHYQPPTAWSDSFLAASRQLLPGFTPQDLSFTIWGLAQLDIEPPAQWLDVFLVQLRQHVPTMDSAQLSATIWGLAKLNHRPGVDWMQRFLDRVVALTGAAARQQQRDGRVMESSSAEAVSQATVVADDIANSKAVGRGSRPYSKRTLSAAAPPTMLRLSADFSSIILHGLTMWAVQRLEYSVPGSSSSNNGVDAAVDGSTCSEAAEPEIVLAGRATGVASMVASHPSTIPVGRRGSNSGAPLQEVQAADPAVSSAGTVAEAVDEVVAGNAIGGGIAAVVRTDARDGSIVFSFEQD